MRRSLFLSCSLAALAAQDASPTTIPATGAATLVDVTATRLPTDQQTAAVTVITAEDIATHPGNGLAEVLRDQAGVQVRSLYGSRDGAYAAVDLRGFGETAAQNSLVIVDGRRLNDLDLAGVDLGVIPVEAIERVEILRGGAGGVLYGDGAVGGVINIVTRRPPVDGSTGSFTGTVGSDGWRKASGRAGAARGPVRAIVQGVVEHDDGWGDHSAMDRGEVLGEVGIGGPRFDLLLRGGASEREQELPGARRIAPVDQLADDPRGTSTPDDAAATDTWFVGAVATWRIDGGTALLVDAERRDKEQSADLVSWGGTDERLITQDRLAPRLTAPLLGGVFTAGVDWSRATFDQTSDYGFGPTITTAEQDSTAGYAHLVAEPGGRWQVTAGVRLQRVDFTLESPATLEQEDDLVFADLGVARRLAGDWRWYARGGRSNRVPTVDERGTTADSDYRLEVQTSWDAETGLALDAERAQARIGVYGIWLRNELAYDPGVGAYGANTNLDPTRRLGIESEGRLRPVERLVLNASATWVRSEFTAGSFDGEPVPLVAPWTLGGGATWEAADWVWISGSVTWIDESRRGSDYQGDSPDIPDRTQVAARVGGSIDRLRWSAAIQHWLDDQPYDTGFYSSFSGAYNAYPYAPTTLSASVGMTF